MTYTKEELKIIEQMARAFHSASEASTIGKKAAEFQVYAMAAIYEKAHLNELIFESILKKTRKELNARH